LTGCLAITTTSKANKDHAVLFSSGLQELEKNGNADGLKTLAGLKPESDWSIYARSILKSYSTQQKELKSLQKKHKALTAENKKLRGDLEKLNQINLELEKRSN
jgi:predicted nuclease with TOPRIM domain